MKWNNKISYWIRFSMYWLLQIACMYWAADIAFNYHPILAPLGVLIASLISTGLVYIAGQSVWSSRNSNNSDAIPLIGIGIVGLVLVPTAMYFSGFSSSIDDMFKGHDFTIQDLKLIFPLVVFLFEAAFEMRYNINFRYTPMDKELIVPLHRIAVLTIWLFFVPYWMLKWIFYNGGTNDYLVAAFRFLGMIACPILIPLLAFGYYLSPPLFIYMIQSEAEHQIMVSEQARLQLKIWKANPFKSKYSIERNFIDHKISLSEAKKYMEEYYKRHK